MSYAYDELYLPLAQSMMGDMYDYAVNTLGYELEQFQRMFLAGKIHEQIARGNSMYIAGMNGCEVAKCVIEDSTGIYPEAEDCMYMDRSIEYWIGWTLAYCQWECDCSFIEIDRALPVTDLYCMYPTHHEADVSMTVEVLRERLCDAYPESALRRIRRYAMLSQSELAKQSGVPLRQIQLFEQGQRDIAKTQVTTVMNLAKVLHCKPADLLDK